MNGNGKSPLLSTNSEWKIPFIFKTFLTLQYFITASTENISNIILARQSISQNEKLVGGSVRSPFTTGTLPHWIVVQARRSTVAEFWWV